MCHERVIQAVLLLAIGGIIALGAVRILEDRVSRTTSTKDRPGESNGLNNWKDERNLGKNGCRGGVTVGPIQQVGPFRLADEVQPRRYWIYFMRKSSGLRIEIAPASIYQITNCLE